MGVLQKSDSVANILVAHCTKVVPRVTATFVGTGKERRVIDGENRGVELCKV